MKRLAAILIPLCLAAYAASALEPAFEQAQSAYDAGRYPEAASRYQEILESGIVNPEIHYNLANACFKAGELPRAVFHYRKAWYDAPRDPDIQANLRFALNAAGAIEPAPSFVRRTLSRLSAREWTWTAVAAYPAGALLLILAMLARPARAVLLRLCLVPLAVLLLAAAGWRSWHGYRTAPEGVVSKAGTTALYGPVEGATAYYKVPAGALVRQRGSDPKGWVEIEYDGKKGWISQDNILPLWP